MAATFRLDEGPGYFVKQTSADCLDQLTAEAEGLAALAATATVRVPGVELCEIVTDRACLVMEWLDLGTRDQGSDARLGGALAGLHGHTHQAFGWQADNFIGRSPQHNAWHQEWPDFFFTCRLAPQLEWLGPEFSRLAGPVQQSLARDLQGHDPVPSLVHGDLWSGNAAALVDGQPVVYDPAVHYADRECDLAMTRMFGGFGPAFYQAYQARWPLPPGADRREPWYRLYHLLNHANLFGAGYRRQSRQLIGELT